MESFFARHKNATILGVVLALQILGLATQIKRPTESGSVRLIRQWAVAVVTPFEKVIVHSELWAHRTWRGYFYLRDVRRENSELREQIERMKLEQVRMQQDADQARRIQALLQFKEQYIAHTVAAQVIGSSGTETSHLIFIDRGTRDGVQPNMAVITPAGIVGKVLRVYSTTSQVLEITDQTSGVGATLVNSRLQGILKGQAAGNPNLAYIMADENISPGEDVITSGGDRIFPKGLPIGKVESVSPGKDLFLNIRINPSARLDRLEEVLVITQVDEKEPDTKGLGPIRAADILAQRLPSVPDKSAETQPAGTTAASTPAAGVTTPKPGNTTGGNAGSTTQNAKPQNKAATGGTASAQNASKPQSATGGAVSAKTPASSNAPGAASGKPAASTGTAMTAKPAPTTGTTSKPATSAAGTASKPATTASGAASKPGSTASPTAKSASGEAVAKKPQASTPKPLAENATPTAEHGKPTEDH